MNAALRHLPWLTLLLTLGCTQAEPAPKLAPKLLDLAEAEPPGFRVCCLFGYDLSPVPTVPLFQIRNTIDPTELGTHEFGGSLTDEQDGLIYTRAGGFVDTGHLRDYADWTLYLAGRLAQDDGQGRPIALPDHGGRVQLVFRPPPGPPDPELTIRVAQRAAFEFSVWHEIATWYGWRLVPIYPERVSAFSPEDLYSNLLGATVGARSLRRYLATGEEISALVDRETKATLASLHAVSQEQTERALDRVEGVEGWWDRTRGVPSFDGVLRRHLALGPTITPWLVPGLGPPSTPQPLSVPTHAPDGRPLSDHFTLTVRVDGVPGLPAGRVIDASEFPRIVEAIRRETKVQLGPLADRPTRIETIGLGAGRRVKIFRSGERAWQFRVERATRRGWRVHYQRAFPNRHAAHEYLHTRLHASG